MAKYYLVRSYKDDVWFTAKMENCASWEQAMISNITGEHPQKFESFNFETVGDFFTNVNMYLLNTAEYDFLRKMNLLNHNAEKAPFIYLIKGEANI